MVKGKPHIIKFLKKHEWQAAYIGLFLTIIIALLNYVYPNVVIQIQKETVYRTSYQLGLEDTLTLTDSVTVTIERAYTTTENSTIP